MYAQANKAILKHYRDSSGQEVNAIVEMPNGEVSVKFSLVEKGNDSNIKISP